MAQAASSTSTRKAGEDVADKAARAGDRIENFAEQGRQATEQVQVVADNFRSAVDKSVKDQPLTTLAMAAGLGFIIGALWKS